MIYLPHSQRTSSTITCSDARSLNYIHVKHKIQLSITTGDKGNQLSITTGNKGNQLSITTGNQREGSCIRVWKTKRATKNNYAMQVMNVTHT